MPALMLIKYINNKRDESIDPCSSEPKVFTKTDAMPRKQLVGIYLISMSRSILEVYL